VSGEQTPQDAHVEQVSSKLTEGLKTCRAMVSHYRTMLTSDQSGKTSKRDTRAGDCAAVEELPPNHK
jgi:hypothetical protein